jgi:hypothetical protein
MGKVTAGGTMSLDGYIAGPEESGFDLLFQWYGKGDVEIPSASPDVPPPRISRGERGADQAGVGEYRRAGRRPAPLRHDQRLGRAPPDERDHGRAHPPAPRRPS